MTKIRFISSKDIEGLTKFFNIISADRQIKKFFHPHPFTEKQARKICLKEGIKEDLYFMAVKNNEITGYAMLRGWDEGYDIPSFGICIRPDYQGQGIGKLLTQFAIEFSKKKKAPKIILKVYKNNFPAYNLYRQIGFEFTGETEDRKQWIGYLKL